MYSQFGQKWSRLQQGPMWNVVFSVQASEGVLSVEEPGNSNSCSTMKVRNYANHVGEALLSLYYVGLG